MIKNKIKNILKLIILIEFTVLFIIITNKLVELKRNYKLLHNDYVNLNEKVNRIKAELIIRNEYLEK